MKAGVIGHPITHSKSPMIHNHWMEFHKIKGTYEAIDIAPENLQEKIANLIVQKFDGFNVTVPHKQTVMMLCNTVDENAKNIGAVNTVIIKDQKLHGTNTDAFGFIQNIKWQSDFDFKDKTAFVLGAGGAACAVIYGLIDAGVKQIKLSNRTRENAEVLAALYPSVIKVIDWEERSQAIDNVDFLVNTTSLGMQGKPPLEISLDHLPAHALVNDIVYAPLKTDLLNNASLRGNKIITGIGMLLHQARPAFEAWTGILPDVTDTLEGKITI